MRANWLRCQLSSWYARLVERQTEELSAWLNLIQTHEAVAAGLEDMLKRANGLSLAQHEVLVRLAEAPEGRLRMLDLTGLVLLSKSGMTRMIDRMERDGLVERQSCDTDRRVVYAAIMPKGRRILDETTPVFLAGIEEHFSRHLSEAEVRALRKILRKLLAGNGQWEEARCEMAPASASARLAG
jgi:DNA-binding MarR family transcriptional regulator